MLVKKCSQFTSETFNALTHGLLLFYDNALIATEITTRKRVDISHRLIVAKEVEITENNFKIP